MGRCLASIPCGWSWQTVGPFRGVRYPSNVRTSLILDGQLGLTAPEGAFTLDVRDVLIPIGIGIGPNFGLVSLTDADDVVAVDTIAISPVQGGTTADVFVTFDDTSVHTYELDLMSGVLIQTT